MTDSFKNKPPAGSGACSPSDPGSPSGADSPSGPGSPSFPTHPVAGSRLAHPANAVGYDAFPELDDLPDLPIRSFLPEISSRLAARGRLVLKAEPGAGKTSLVPLHLARIGVIRGRIIVLEPRRMAAVAAARRSADLWRCPVGSKVGYRVRGDSRTSRETIVEFMTHGVFLRIIQSDPSLASIGLVIFDEFHERNWQNDLCFALCRDILELREDLRILVMSATLDTASCEAALDCLSLCIPGMVYPVETRYVILPSARSYQEKASRETDTLSRETDTLSRETGALSREAVTLARECGGDVLVFLPGIARIIETGRQITALSPELAVFRLHSSIPLREQLEVLDPPPEAPRRIILATSIAETSLTVPRVRGVVDSGLVRINRFHQGSGLNRLVTETEASDRADQRRGRAGRTGPGICVRLWPERDLLPSRTVPEILHSELSSACLEAALWGSSSRESLSWMDLPPVAAWNAARELLVLLGALDPSGRITDSGRRMASLGLEPRLSAIVLRAASPIRDKKAVSHAAFLAAFLADQSVSSTRTDSDIESTIERLDAVSRARISEEAGRLASLASPISPASQASPTNVSGFQDLSTLSGMTGSHASTSRTGAMLACGFPDRIARRVSKEGASALFRLAAGRLIRAAGSLSAQEWIVAADADAGAGDRPGTLYSGAGLTEEEALAVLAPGTFTRFELEWIGVSWRARTRKTAFALTLSETPSGKADPQTVSMSFVRHLETEGLSILPWDDSCRSLLARIRAFWPHLLDKNESADNPLPDFLDESFLETTANAWLLPRINAHANPVLDTASLHRALADIVPARLREAFRKETPEYITLPAGNRRMLQYRPDGSVLLEARVHEFFGMKTHPLVMGKPVVACLLSPAGRPAHITTDIPGFWRGTWKDVRKELRGRYPRHDWPEDPSLVEPRARSVKPKP